ncbi:MAG: TolC family protein [Kiritimatiellae bacterium]|nr:TolC family protein [Kiritimatiellia bacterium]
MRMTGQVPAHVSRGPARRWSAVWVLVSAALPAAGASGVAPLTLDEAIATALAHNRTLAVGQLQVMRRALDVEAAQRQFDPTASPMAQGLGLGSDRQWTLGFQIVQPTRVGTRLNASAAVIEREGTGASERTVSIGVEQPLFRRFGREVHEAALAEGREQYAAERRHWEQQRADLVLRLIECIEVLVRLEAQIGLERERAERLSDLVRLVRLRERQGRSTLADVIRMEQSLEEARARIAELDERREARRRELSDLLGVPLSPDRPLEPPPRLDAPLPTPELAVAIAISNRLDLAQAEADADAARRRGRLAQRRVWPDVSLSVSLRRTLYELDAGAIGEDERTDWFAGFAVDGFPWRAADRIARRQAVLDEIAADEAVAMRRDAIARQVLDALAFCRRAETEAAIAARSRELAEAQLRLVRRLYELGRGDAFALSDGETRYAAATQRAVETASTARLAAYALRHTLGTLVEHPAELKPERR